jgi:hypothetical protein
MTGRNKGDTKNLPHSDFLGAGKWLKGIKIPLI